MDDADDGRVQLNTSISPNLLGVAEVLREFQSGEEAEDETSWTPPKEAGLGNAESILDVDGAKEVGQIMTDLDDEEDNEAFSLSNLQGGIDANVLAFFGQKAPAAAPASMSHGQSDEPSQLSGIFRSKPGEWKAPTQSGLSHSERIF